ncbi:hypothetical protein B0J18DRAFT_217162 [Chaetomium sp. MPI-SDFR-AT-0129]|nr:hypothetical protein B0J18DRAFT_217162 [Chaetomium sp. MPI-SDFR-AT-0129]
MHSQASILRSSLHSSAGRVSAATVSAVAAVATPPSWSLSARATDKKYGGTRLCAAQVSTASQLPLTPPLPPTTTNDIIAFREPTTPRPDKAFFEPAHFTPSAPFLSYEPSNYDPPSNNNEPPEDRKVKLGKTLRILQTHLPTLLESPPPQQILAPSITLHLFPSTHPHLPTVSGRVAYTAALWSSPIAWNRVPLVGNVRLEILSERMVDNPVYSSGRLCDGGRGGVGGDRGDGRGRRPEGARGEQLIVRWRTVGGAGRKLRDLLRFGNDSGAGGDNKNKSLSESETTGNNNHTPDNPNGIHPHGGKQPGREPDEPPRVPIGMAQAAGSSSGKEFTGLFIFDFDSEGRILNHIIEHVEESGHWEKGVGARVVGLTDWLLGGIKGGDAPCPAFARARIRRGGRP